METSEYTKIELLKVLKNGSINKLTFEKCNIKFSGNFIILSTIVEENNKICEVFDLSDVKSYKLYE